MPTQEKQETITQRFKFIGHESAFCHIEIEQQRYTSYNGDGTINTQCNDKTTAKLISFETCVSWIEYDYIHDTCVLYCDGNYSRSTIKHIGWFTKQFIGENRYYMIRDKLKMAIKLNKEGCHITYVDIPLSWAFTQNATETMHDYLRKGQKFTKYAKEPNYDYLYYGHSKFNALNLR